MPIPNGTLLNAIPGMLAANIANYNSPANRRGAFYNTEYQNYIQTRNTGLANFGGLSGWVTSGGASHAIWALLNSFGMNARNSRLVAIYVLHTNLTQLTAQINPATLNWLSTLALPLQNSPPLIPGPIAGTTLVNALQTVYCYLEQRGSVTNSGGFAAASKVMHCLFPDLVPIIDGKHLGRSYYHIRRNTYLPPMRLANWAAWLGAPMNGNPNPSPQGAGRQLWGWHQFVAAIGINQHIYELWQNANGAPGQHAFLALDQTGGSTGIPRLIDKGLW